MQDSKMENVSWALAFIVLSFQVAHVTWPGTPGKLLLFDLAVKRHLWVEISFFSLKLNWSGHVIIAAGKETKTVFLCMFSKLHSRKGKIMDGSNENSALQIYSYLLRKCSQYIFICKLSPISTMFSWRSVELKWLDMKYIFICIMVLDLSSFVSILMDTQVHSEYDK